MPLKKMKGTSLLVLVLVLVFGNIAVVYSGLPKSNGGGKEELTPSYSIGSALRYLSKGVFTNALAKDNQYSAEDHLRLASLQDSSDCVKRLICELQAKQPLDWDEKLIMRSIPQQLDFTSPIVQFQLASELGKKQPQQCSVVYSRCGFNAADIMGLMRQRGTSLDIRTNDEYDCTVLFLWNKKFPDKPKGGDGQA